MEIWKDVVGFEGLYQVSNLGNVKILIRKGVRIEKLLKQYNHGGYNRVYLFKNLIRHNLLAHRLVGLAFVKGFSHGLVINHINGIKNDNREENLEWVSQKENVNKSWELGLSKISYNHHFYTNHPSKGKFGKDNIKSKKINQYDLQGNFIKTWYGTHEIQRELGCSFGYISRICRENKKIGLGYIWEYKKD